MAQRRGGPRLRAIHRYLTVVGAALLLVVAAPAIAAVTTEPGGTFTDDDSSVHQPNIEAIASLGITKGCNPPVNDRFCPGDPVTRGQMAAFLVRALGLVDDGGGNSFVDVVGSVFEGDVARLAAAGITKGCNPPDNDRYCPHDPVTRAQMATFLARALSLDPIPVPPRLPQTSPDPLVLIGLDNWLYAAPTIEQQPLDPAVVDRATTELEKAAAVVTNSGRGFVYAVVPNKVAIHSGTAPVGTWSGSAAESNSVLLRAALGTVSASGLVTMWDEFSAAAGSTPQYFKHDTHWNGEGARIGSELIAAKAAPGSWDATTVSAQSATRAGDLAGLLGIEWIVGYDRYATAFPGVTPAVATEGVDIALRPVVRYQSPAAPGVWSDRTAIIHDSFGLLFRQLLGPLFEDVAFLPTFSHPVPDDVRPFVIDADQLVIEVVERNVVRDLLVAGTAGQLAAALADDYPKVAVTHVRSGDQVEFAIPAASPGEELRYLIVEADVTQAVLLRDDDDIDIGPDQGAWPNELQPDTGRYGFEVLDPAGGALQINLPQSATVTGAYVIVVE
jgi:hypothetical protein